MSQTNTVQFLTLDALAALVQGGQRVGVGGALFSRLPVALLKAIVARRPKGLEYITWGGGLPLEMLLAVNAVGKIVFCFSSLDIFGLAPLFRKALEEGTVEVEEWNALAMIQGFHAAEQNLPSLPFPLPVGSELVEKSGFARMYRDPVTDRVVGAARALPLDVLLLHAQRADEAGNVEIQGARGLDRSAIGAATSVLVTVEEVVPEGTFQHGPRATIIPRTFVTAIARALGGAYPTSCLPYYPTDYRALHTATSTVPLQIPEADAERMAFLNQAAQIPAQRVTGPVLLRHRPKVDLNAPPTIDEQMVVTLARHYSNESICSAGAVSPLAVISYMLAKKTHAPDLVMMMVSGGLVDPAVRPMLLVLAEALDFHTSVVHCGGDDTYHWYYQRGSISHEVVSAAQVDQYGRANNIFITTPSGKRVRLPGQGGMADVANLHQHFLMYITRHSSLTLVDEVEYASAARGLLADEERQALGLRPGYMRLVTDLGVFELNKTTRLLELISVHPGVSIEQVEEATGFSLRQAPDVGVTDPPTPEEIELIRTEIDPLGVRRLEFVPARDRTSLIAEILDGEEAAIAEMIG